MDLSSLGAVGTAIKALIILLEVLMIFNLLIIVHEWGHFLAARWRKLRIEKFQIWFGKPLWSRTFNGVQYGLGWIPAGGFVQLPQMAPMGAIEGETSGEPLPPISALDKIIVAFAGPLFSFLLALAFAFIVSAVGAPDRVDHSTQIGYVLEDSPAGKAGLKAGDTIVSIDGTRVKSWNDSIDSVIERVAFSKNDLINVEVQRPGQEKTIVIPCGFSIEPGSFIQRSGIRRLGIVQATLNTHVAHVGPGSPAERAGIKPGDVVEKVNDEPLYSPLVFDFYFKNHPDGKLKTTVKRGDQHFEAVLSAEKPSHPAGYPVAMPGLFLEADNDDRKDVILYPTPWEQITKASSMIVRTISGLLMPGGSLNAQHVGGPVMIVSMEYRILSQDDGWRRALMFCVVLNVNLALMNLLPFPVLDGGHIVMGFIEMLRRRPTLNFKALEVFQTACALLLIGFMLFVSWFDAWDLLGNGKKKDPFAEVKLDDLKWSAPGK